MTVATPTRGRADDVGVKRRVAARAPGADRVGAGVQPTFADIGTPLAEVTFVVVDLETTGMRAHDSGITEIGAVKVRGGEVLGEFQSLVNAGRPVSAFIARLTGITQAMVATAPDIDLVLPSFLEWAHGCVLVAHNANFDVGFLKAACLERGYEWPGFPVIDTVPLARRVVTKDEARDCKLCTLAALFRADTNPDHRALSDARATVDVFHGVLSRLGNLGVHYLEDLATAGDPVPVAVRRKTSLADGLPEAPGVYQFIGPKDEVLYVGKSLNLRKRVRSYFTAAEKRKAIIEMVQIAERVEPIVCATELEAAVRELRLIAAKAPRYNRRSKHPNKTVWVRLTDEAYPRLTVVRSVADASVPHIGPFPSQSAALEAIGALHQALPIRQCTGKLALHPKTVGSPCALAGMHKCSAPCLAIDSPDEDYASVVEQVLAALSGDPRLVVENISERVGILAAAGRFEEAGLQTHQLRVFLLGAAKAQRLYPLAVCPELVAARPLTPATRSDPRAAVTLAHPGRASVTGWELLVAKYGQLAGAAICYGDATLSAQIAAVRATAAHVTPAIPPMPAGLPEEASLILDWLDSPGVRLVAAATPWALPVRSAIPYQDLTEVCAAVTNALDAQGLKDKMMMGLVDALTQPKVWAQLANLPPYDEAATMARLTKLRNDGLAPDVAAAMLTQSRLRAKGRPKLGAAVGDMLLTDDGVEQATRPLVAQIHAQRYRTAGIAIVADLTCGIGADARAFADAGLKVIATDINPDTAAIAAWNLRDYPSVTVKCSDGLAQDFALENIQGIYADPARRIMGGKRVFDPEAYAPPLDAIIELQARVPALGIKIGPGIPHDAIPKTAEAQWVSVDGDVVECGLWFGPLALTGIGRNALVVQTNGLETFSRIVRDDGLGKAEPAPNGSIGKYLYEPDGAVIRAGLVGTIARQINGWLLDPTIAYITSDNQADTTALSYRIMDTLPFGVKTLKKYLRERNIGRVAIKKRGTAVTPEALRPQLQLKGDNEATIVLTRINGAQSVLIVEPIISTISGKHSDRPP